MRFPLEESARLSDSWNMQRHVRLGQSTSVHWPAERPLPVPLPPNAPRCAAPRCHNLWCYRAQWARQLCDDMGSLDCRCLDRRLWCWPQDEAAKRCTVKKRHCETTRNTRAVGQSLLNRVSRPHRRIKLTQYIWANNTEVDLKIICYLCHIKTRIKVMMTTTKESTKSRASLSQFGPHALMWATRWGRSAKLYWRQALDS